MGVIWETSFASFALLTCVVGGATAYMAGRGLALTWQPVRQVVLYMLLMGAAVRFLQFALFDGTLLSSHFYLIDTSVLMAFALLGFRLTRARQMTARYSWLCQATSPLTWSKR
jgi:hypothetical protein